MQNLGEDILLLAITRNGTIAAYDRMHFALAGAALARLIALRRVEVVKGRIVVIDTTPTADPLLDEALGHIYSSRRPPHARNWIGRQRSTVTEQYLAMLTMSGAARCEVHRRLGLFRVRRWFVRDVARVERLRAQLDAIAYSDGPIDAMQAAFGGLIHVTGLDSMYFPRGEGRRARKRLKTLAQYSEAAVAVTAALRARQAAMAATVSAGT
ncbi:GPP34 family phosphoprotein [Actinospica durhamensis]|uniref:GPP34 family phosphoprotein n=1 Tax=Actinospica durhamensis TaxID=1508375 RepID=A0A941IV33_9ACTN|nr:GPP34 family phosphoprotein [Actinospica durhamensis]MBR7836381.1 GPP34 family phosphoprotein [Actinospica durhamensis]